jgi:DNA-binding FrmR family transcriptional regulator
MLCGRKLDAHAANRIDGLLGRAILAVLTAAAGPGLCAVAMVMARVLGARAMSVIVARPRHRSSPSTLDQYTLWGYMSRMRDEIKASCLRRLKRIEGQIRGLAGMVEDDRYCIDVVTQIAAAKAALRRVEEEILHDHVAHCVEHAISSGDKADQRRKIAELMEVIGRADR